MATFYLLPSRVFLEQALGDLLGKLLPGLPLPAETWDAVTERLAAAAQWSGDVFLIPRDDLPDGERLGESLASAFGAEAGDRVVDVGVTRGPRTWVLSPADVSSPVAAH
jgi:hypothetical protein